MRSMPRALTVLAVIAVGLAVALIGEALDFGGLAYLAALVVGLLLVSLTDRDRFYLRDLRPHR